ncbi:low temperature requirement protein LtrA [Streptococcus saliviloxodontae]|uniref:Low temperature requirement protein LtrA n=1 Tax=Streptococcus saliviloxodontae TaxID=1349416 RepID=A0ABS2PJS2_9STRE|nr:low temperature requirement protein LtrA [Streptococcus saliviloxodontae]
MAILAWRFTFLFIALLTFESLDIYPFLIGFGIGLFLLYFYRRKLSRLPLNYAHISERFTLLVIIAFGEMLMSGIASYFTLESFSLLSPLVFLMILLLFHIYRFEFDQHIHCLPASSLGLRLVYVHYPIFLGMAIITVSLAFVPNEGVDSIFLVSFFYLGLGLFLLGILWQNLFHRPRGKEGRQLAWRAGLLYGVSLSLAIWQGDNRFLELVIIGLTLLVMTYLHRYYSRT